MFCRSSTFHVAISDPEAHASGSLPHAPGSLPHASGSLPHAFRLPPSAFLWLVGLLLWAPSGPAVAATQPAWHEGFEGPDPSWRNAGGDAIYHILQQQRVQGHAHSGQRSEWLKLVGNNGTSAYISHDVGRPRVIDELLPSVWIWSDRSGLQFAADVVLPRAIDRRTGKPLVARIFGDIYSSPGHWQQLRIENIPRLLTRQLRVMRSQLGTDIDGREAYIPRVLLNVYGGPGETNVWIDDLEIAGYVGAAPLLPGAAPPRPVPRPGVPGGISTFASQGPVLASFEPRTRSGVHLSESVLLAADHPLFPRVIQYQGEPLSLLKRLGFNALWLPELPSPELSEEAQRLGLWLVCPPPRPAQSGLSGAAPAALGQFGPEFQQVMAWDLGSDLLAQQLDAVSRWADQVRVADLHRDRPLICAPRNDLRAYSRKVDLLLIDRRPLGSSLELADYGAWVRRQPLLALPGTPVWTTVQTQPSEGLRRQLLALQPGCPLPTSVTGDQIRLMVYTAISSGSRGLLFLSRSPLSATDPETRRRAMELELLNLELQLIETWAAGGTFVTTAETSSLNITGAVLRADRTRLVLPLWSGPGAQCVTSQFAGDKLTMVVPGTPESTLAYDLALGQLQPLRKKRTTGGIRVTLDNFGLSGMVVFAQDPLIVDAVTRLAARFGQRQAELECALADQEVAHRHRTGGAACPACAAAGRRCAASGRGAEEHAIVQ